MIKGSSSTSIEIEAHTWPRDSHGLFDYENSSMPKQKLKATPNDYIVRKENRIQICSPNSAPPDAQILAQLKQTPSGTLLQLINDEMPNQLSYEKLCNLLWQPAPKYRKKGPPGNKIREGSILKIGRLLVKVMEVRWSRECQLDLGDQMEPSACSTVNDDYNMNKIDETLFQDQARPPEEVKQSIITSATLRTNADFTLSTESIIQDKKEEEATEQTPSGKLECCRFCLEEGVQDIRNPLISPCGCKGYQKYIHFQCLRKWVEQKVEVRRIGATTLISMEHARCQICLQAYPLKIRILDQEFSLLDLPKQGPHAIFETIQIAAKHNRNIYIIRLSNQPMLMGRGKNTALRIRDISISREHARLEIVGGSLYLADKGSKFGTLFLVESVVVEPGEPPLFVQIGRTRLKLSSQFSKWKSLFGTCYCASENDARSHTKRPVMRRANHLDTLFDTQRTFQENDPLVIQQIKSLIKEKPDERKRSPFEDECAEQRYH